MIGPGERLDVRRVAELHLGPAGGAANLPGVQLGNGRLPGVRLGDGGFWVRGLAGWRVGGSARCGGWCGVPRVAELHHRHAGGAANLPGVQLGNGMLPGARLGDGVLPGVELGSGVLPGARAVGAGLVRRATPLAAGDQVG
jgi:hypothetical protein